jgi:acyl-CoA reductase-like NAD-dependent aldehyde dehydrogenase
MIPELQIDWRNASEFQEMESAFVDIKDLRELVDEAIHQARAAFQQHRGDQLRNRLRVISDFRARLAREAASIAWKLSAEAQRTPEEFLASEIVPLLDACHFLERNAKKLLRSQHYGGWSMPMWLRGTRHEVTREPLGVVLVIGASNYPLFLPGVQVLQAFVAGNAVLLKPSPAGVHSASTLLEILNASGLPRHLVQSLPSATNAAGHAIGRNIDKVFFTGSAETGRKVLIHTGTALTPAVMELSGCDASFVLPDAEMNHAAQSIAFGLTLNSGRTCIAPRRAFVWKEALGEFSNKLKSELESRPKIFTKESPQGEFIANVFDALSQGAEVLHGAVAKSGLIEGPLVLTHLDADLPFATAENWGANLSIIPVSSEQEALRFYQRSAFALGASIFTTDDRAAQRIARSIEAGSVCINDLVVPTADGRLPFGGRKKSGFGSTRGPEGLLEMTAPKVISTRRGGMPMHLQSNNKDQFELLSAYCGLAYGAGHERWRSFRKLLKTILNRDAMQPRIPNE